MGLIIAFSSQILSSVLERDSPLDDDVCSSIAKEGYTIIIMSSLFSVCNAFHLGAYQVAINEASELTELSATEQVEKDCYAYRSYVALGSYQVHHRIALFLFFSLSLSLFGFSLSLFVCVARRRGETRGDRSSGVDGETTTTTTKKKKKKKKRAI